MPALTYLYALAALAVTFVGFSALVIILRQTMGGQMSMLDILITRIFIQLGFIVAGGAMLPALLLLFDLPPTLVWRLASATAAVPSLLFAATYPRRRRIASGMPTPLVIWVVAILAACGIALACNAAGAGFVPNGALFAAALTGIFFFAAWAYLQALHLLLRPHIARLKGPGTDP